MIQILMKDADPAIYERGGGPSPDIDSASTLILDFPASKTEKNKFLPSSMILSYNNLNGLR